MQIQLKKCEHCGMYLLPFETPEGNILIHPYNKECKNLDYFKSYSLNVSVLDDKLFDKYLDLYGKSEYTLEQFFKCYDDLIKELDEVRHHAEILENKSIFEIIKDRWRKRK